MFQWYLIIFIAAACILLFMRTQLYRRFISHSSDKAPAPASGSNRIIWIPDSFLHSRNRGSSTPWIARQVEASWRHHNPTWRVERIRLSSAWTYFASDRKMFLESYPAYASIASSEEQLDFIKIHILARYGGVWVDPLLLCLRPLDAWIEQAIGPTGFFMYRYQKHTLFHEQVVGFLAALPESYLLQTWQHAAYAYINNPQRIRDPHWCMSLFEHCLHTDDRFLSDWNSTPSLWADAEGEAGIFVRNSCNNSDSESTAVRLLLDKHPTLSRLFRLHPPPILQLPSSMAHLSTRIQKRIPKESLLQTLLLS